MNIKLSDLYTSCDSIAQALGATVTERFTFDLGDENSLGSLKSVFPGIETILTPDAGQYCVLLTSTEMEGYLLTIFPEKEDGSLGVQFFDTKEGTAFDVGALVVLPEDTTLTLDNASEYLAQNEVVAQVNNYIFGDAKVADADGDDSDAADDLGEIDMTKPDPQESEVEVVDDTEEEEEVVIEPEGNESTAILTNLGNLVEEDEDMYTVEDDSACRGCKLESEADEVVLVGMTNDSLDVADDDDDDEILVDDDDSAMLDDGMLSVKDDGDDEWISLECDEGIPVTEDEGEDPNAFAEEPAANPTAPAIDQTPAETAPAADDGAEDEIEVADDAPEAADAPAAASSVEDPEAEMKSLLGYYTDMLTKLAQDPANSVELISAVQGIISSLVDNLEKAKDLEEVKADISKEAEKQAKKEAGEALKKIEGESVLGEADEKLTKAEAFVKKMYGKETLDLFMQYCKEKGVKEDDLVFGDSEKPWDKFDAWAAKQGKDVQEKFKAADKERGEQEKADARMGKKVDQAKNSANESRINEDAELNYDDEIDAMYADEKLPALGPDGLPVGSKDMAPVLTPAEQLGGADLRGVTAEPDEVLPGPDTSYDDAVAPLADEILTADDNVGDIVTPDVSGPAVVDTLAVDAQPQVCPACGAPAEDDFGLGLQTPRLGANGLPVVTPDAKYDGLENEVDATLWRNPVQKESYEFNPDGTEEMEIVKWVKDDTGCAEDADTTIPKALTEIHEMFSKFSHKLHDMEGGSEASVSRMLKCQKLLASVAMALKDSLEDIKAAYAEDEVEEDEYMSDVEEMESTGAGPLTAAESTALKYEKENQLFEESQIASIKDWVSSFKQLL